MLKIQGILATPRVSRNNNLYLPVELARADGLTVPLYLDHEDFRDDSGRLTGGIVRKEARGKARLIWNAVLQRLEYVGEVWDSLMERLIRSGQRPHVSLAAEPRNFTSFAGHNVPLDMQFFSVGVVQNPGIPESTVNIIEAYLGSLLPTIIESARPNLDRMYVLEFDTDHLEFREEEISEELAKDGYLAVKLLRAAGKIRKEGGVPASTGQSPSAVSEPLHPDFQKMKTAMKAKYGSDDIYYATVNKHGFDDTKPMPKEAEMAFNTLVPPGYQNLTPLRGKLPDRSGLTGITGVSMGVPMQGDGTNPVQGPQDQQVRVNVSPTGQPQQIAPRNLQPKTSIDNRNATSLGVGTGAYRSEANKTRTGTARQMSVEEEAGRGNASQALQKQWGAETDKSEEISSAATPHDVGVKSIGLKSTPYEALRERIVSGKAKPWEFELYNIAVKEKRVSPPGDAHSQPNALPTAGVTNTGAGSFSPATREEEEEEEEDDDEANPFQKKAEEEMADYGFSKEQARNLMSVYTKEEWPATWRTIKTVLATNPNLKEFILRNRMPELPVTQRTESRVAGPGVEPSVRVSPIYSASRATDLSSIQEQIQKHAAYIAARGARIQPAGISVPFMFPPPVMRATGLQSRLEFVDELSNWTATKQRLIAEDIATTTSGAAMAVDGAVPALIVPTQLSASLRDTVYFQQIQQGSNTARFQTITVPAAGALTQNTEPSAATQTLATVDIAPTPRGVEQPISFEAERKILGPILEGIILSFRVSELYDEDTLLIGSSVGAFPNATIPTTGGLYNTGNQLFAQGRATEGAIISTDTFALANLTDAQDVITAAGYAPNNLVCVMQPPQFRKLLQDSNVNRLISFGPNTTPAQSWVAQGVIPELVGFEIRRSTLGTTGTGSASITTYNAWAYVKGLTPAMAASRDVMIETFRDIRKNSTVVKGHWDLKCAVLHPNSLVQIDTA